MKIKFTCDFQGVETGGIFYRLGQVVTLADNVAARLVSDKRAVVVEDEQPQAIEQSVVITPAPQYFEQPRRRGRK